MASISTIHRSLALVGLLCLLGGFAPAVARAASVGFDSGVELSNESPYDSSQSIANAFDSQKIYGKFDGTTPVDIYGFKPDRDGTQTFSLLALRRVGVDEAEAQLPYLIFIDPTEATEASNLGIPLPSDSYHASILKEKAITDRFNEPLLLQRYHVAAEQQVELKKDTQYYVIVFDTTRQFSRYVFVLGDRQIWGAKDLISKLPSWFKVKTDLYAASSPYTFSASVLSLILFLLSLSALVGILIVHEVFSLLANRSKAAGYLLTRVQPYARLTIWLSLWFLALGGYGYFGRRDWIGVPFVLTILAVPIIINMLYLTIRLSPQISALEVSHREVTVPFALRKRLFFSSLITLLSVGAFLAFAATYFA